MHASFGSLAIGTRFSYRRGNYVKVSKNKAMSLPQLSNVGVMQKFSPSARVCLNVQNQDVSQKPKRKLVDIRAARHQESLKVFKQA